MRSDAIIVDMSITNEVVLPQIAQERLKRLESRTAKIGVIGLGYVGLPLSLLLSEAGFKVTGFDIDSEEGDRPGGGTVLHLPHSCGGDSERAETGLYGYG